MNTITHGVQEICSITDTLNDIILQSGAIDINNKTIWDGYLHRWSNDDWRAMLEVMGEVTTQTFNTQPWHERNLADALETFVAEQNQPRCMDQKHNKKRAWKMIMTMREVVNTVRGVRIENK